MKSPLLRRTIRLTVTLLEHATVVWREVIVDRDLTLAELHEAIALAMEWPTTAHYVFTDRDPSTRSDVAGWGGGATRRRWGDRWTMIDWRDPDVIDSSAARVRDAVEHSALYLGCDIAETWWCRIDAHGDDIEHAAGPAVRLTTGSGRAPLPEGPAPDELRRRHAILADRSHPEYENVTAEFASLVGPWTTYAPASSDLDGARAAVTARFPHSEERARSSRRPAARTRTDALVESVSPPARAGLRRHLIAVAAEMRAFASPGEIEETIRPYAWLMSTTAGEGAPLIDGFLTADLVAAGCDILGRDAADLKDLVQRAREMRLVRRWRGRLVALVGAEPVRRSPLALWNHLADALWDRRGAFASNASQHETAALLLSIADGTLADPARGEAHLSAALQTITTRSFGRDEGDGWGYPDRGFSTGWRWRTQGVVIAHPVDGVPHAGALRFLGLERVDGAWRTPTGLQTFAADALAREAPRTPW